MAFIDNRQFIQALERSGDAVSIKQEVDWDLEAGAITRRVCEMRGPAPFFENIKDYPGCRIFGAPLATERRVAIALGLDPEVSPKTIQTEFERRVEHPIKPTIVKDGPCKENIIRGEDVDLYQFPVPMIHEGDGGRYIGTWHLVIVKDPDSDWTNWGMYRLMLCSPRDLTGALLPFRHGGSIFYQKYVPKNQPLPFAVAIGADPICSLTSAAFFRRGESEADYAGALRQEPVELIKCETSDLLVPAHAEIILEGELLPGVTAIEGPFGEFTGYRMPNRILRPVYRVKAITHRNNPILTMTNMGTPIDENDTCCILTAALAVKRFLLRNGIPVTEVHLPPEGTGHLVVVAVRAVEPHLADKIRELLQSRSEPPSMIMVVDEDVDVFNLSEVLHAFASKCHPLEGISATEHDMALLFYPRMSRNELEKGKYGTVSFDCTWPVDWPKETHVPVKSSFNDIYPREMREKVIKSWKSYGFK